MCVVQLCNEKKRKSEDVKFLMFSSVSIPGMTPAHISHSHTISTHSIDVGMKKDTN